MPALGPLVATYAGGAAAGLAARLLHVPLPWLLGPLFFTGIWSALRGGRPVIPGARQAGQAIVGSALGLYFTREVVAAMAEALPWMLVSAVATIATGLAGAAFLRAWARLDPATAFYASVPGGAAEMAVFGERDGGDPAVIALSQALRVAAVVSLYPFALAAVGASGTEPWVGPAADGGPTGLVRLLAVSFGAGGLTALLRIPNGWLLGPLAGSAALTAAGLGAGAFPRGLVDFAQVLMGCALGSRFDRSLLRSARVLLPSLIASALQGMVLLAAFSALLSVLWRHAFFTILLATAPGGIAEMCLTARQLHLGVPVVTAFHVVRLLVVLLASPIVFRAAKKPTEAPSRW